MFGIESLSGSAQAVATVAAVFVEALALYVGYGLLTRIAGATVLDALGGE
ncbi:MAG: hypothetical protein ABEJ74_05080 [Haloferacaceae archaeon]